MNDLISENSSKLQLTMRLVDAGGLFITGYLTGLLHFRKQLDEVAPIHLVLLYVCTTLAFFLFSQLDLYSSLRGRSVAANCRRLAISWAAVLLAGLFFSFLINHIGSISRLWLSYWYLSGLLFLILFRWTVLSSLHFLRKRGLNTKRVVIIGYGRTGQEMHRRALRHDWAGYEVKAIHSACPLPADMQLPKVEHIAALEEVHDYVLAHDIHEIWIALPISASTQLERLQYLLRNALVDIRWVPDLQGMHMLSHKIGDFLGFPAVDLNRPISSGPHGMVKDVFDRLFAALALLLLSPLLLLIAAGIKYSSPGPVLFKQPRHGLNGKKFDVYKFRSMRLHEEHGQVLQATQSDPRITRFGQFLRRTSLDELPQFINVLMGDMSVVGPRPHALQHNDMYKQVLDSYMLRHRVKPGITGWAQIHGYRGETDTLDKMAKRVQFDLYYIQHWSFWMDFRIIVWTTCKGWTGKNAY